MKFSQCVHGVYDEKTEEVQWKYSQKVIYGKVVAKLSNPYQDRVDVAKSLFGVLSTDMSLEEAREERLNTIWEF